VQTSFSDMGINEMATREEEEDAIELLDATYVEK
jgi:hypothetical protein